MLNSTVSGAGNIVFANGSTVTSTGDGSADAPRGVIKPRRPTSIPSSTTITIENIDIVGFTQTERYHGVFEIGYGANVLTLKNVTFENITDSGIAQGGAGVITGSYDRLDTTIDLVGCTVTGVTNAVFAPLLVGGTNCYFGFKDCDIAAPVSTASYVASIEVIRSLNTRVVVDNTCIHGRLTLDGNKSGTVVDLNGSTHGRAVMRDNDSSAVRVFSNTTLTFTTAESQITRGTETIAIGSYDSDNTIYTVGGSATVVYSGGSTVLSGIGTYINSDGTNDFTTPYMVVNTSSSGSGSLLNGINDTTSKYVVIDHSVTDTSAVLNSDITGKEKRFTCGDGRTIVGGTFSLVEGTTVSAHCDVDEHGAHVVSGSTIAILGNTTNLAGNINLGGTLLLDNDCTLANGSTVSGVAGSIIKSIDDTKHVLQYGASDQIAIKNTIIDKSIGFIGPSGYTSRTVTLTGCTSANRTSHLFQHTNAVLIDCDISSTANWSMSSGDGCTYKFNNTKISRGYFNSSIYGSTIANSRFDAENWYMWSKCKIILDGGQSSTNFQFKTTYGGQVFVFRNNVKFTGKMSTDGTGTEATFTGITCVISGSTINMTGNNNNTPIMAPATVKVGTFDDLNKVSTEQAIWTTGGTATIITATGATVKVSGEGTYINKDGTTDLTVVS